MMEPPGHMINIIPNNILYRNVTRERMEYLEFHIRVEHGRPIEFQGVALSFTFHRC